MVKFWDFSSKVDFSVNSDPNGWGPQAGTTCHVGIHISSKNMESYSYYFISDVWKLVELLKVIFIK